MALIRSLSDFIFYDNIRCICLCISFIELLYQFIFIIYFIFFFHFRPDYELCGYDDNLQNILSLIKEKKKHWREGSLKRKPQILSNLNPGPWSLKPSSLTTRLQRLVKVHLIQDRQSCYKSISTFSSPYLPQESVHLFGIFF